MQNSELKKEILGSHKEVSAKELKDYLDGNLNNSQARSVETKLNSSDFSSEAIDGIKTYGSTSSVEVISKKYIHNTINLRILLTLSSISIVILSVWGFMHFSNEEGVSNRSELAETKVEEFSITPYIEEEKNSSIDENHAIEENKMRETSRLEKTPKDSKTKPNSTTESTPILFSVEIENEIFTLDPLEKKKGKLFQKSEKASLKIQSARLRHYRNYKLVDQGIGIDESLLMPVLKGTPALKETIVINPRYPKWVPADSIYRASINEGIDWLINKDYSKAKMRFKRLLENTPEDLSASFYLGYTYYLDEKYDQALTYLQMAQIHVIQTFDHDARFLEIKCYLNLGRDEDALEEALYLKNAESFYAEKAMELVE